MSVWCYLAAAAVFISLAIVGFVLATLTLFALVTVVQRASGFFAARRHGSGTDDGPPDPDPEPTLADTRFGSMAASVLRGLTARPGTYLAVAFALLGFAYFVLLFQVAKPNPASPAQEAIGAALATHGTAIARLEHAVREQAARAGPAATTGATASAAPARDWGRFLFSIAPYVALICVIFLIAYFVERFLNSRGQGSDGQAAEKERRANSFYVRAAAALLSVGSISIGTLVTVQQVVFHFQDNRNYSGETAAPVQTISITMPENKIVPPVQPDTPRYIHTTVLVNAATATRSIALDCSGSGEAGANDMRVFPCPAGWANPDHSGADEDVRNTFDRFTIPSMEAVASRLKQRSARDHLAGIILIGSHDRRPLKTTAKSRHGENSGLAIGRANWVKQQLSEKHGIASPAEIVTTSSGPGRVELEVNGSRTSLAQRPPDPKDDYDRAVQVCALWEETRHAERQ